MDADKMYLDLDAPMYFSGSFDGKPIWGTGINERIYM